MNKKEQKPKQTVNKKQNSSNVKSSRNMSANTNKEQSDVSIKSLNSKGNRNETQFENKPQNQSAISLLKKTYNTLNTGMHNTGKRRNEEDDFRTTNEIYELMSKSKTSDIVIGDMNKVESVMSNMNNYNQDYNSYSKDVYSGSNMQKHYDNSNYAANHTDINSSSRPRLTNIISNYSKLYQPTENIQNMRQNCFEKILKKANSQTPSIPQGQTNSRIKSLYESLVSVISISQLDPILNVFKSNEMLHSTYVKRFYELISKSLECERENFIAGLQDDLDYLNNELSHRNSIIHELEDKENFLRSTLDETLQSFELEVNSKDEMIRKLELELIKKAEAASGKTQVIENYSELNINLKNSNSKLIEDNRLLTESSSKLRGQVLELEGKINSLNDSNRVTLQELELLRYNLAGVKQSNEVLTEKLSNFTKDNQEINQAIKDKDKLVNQLIEKLEAFKQENESLKHDYDSLHRQLYESNNYIESELKPKNKALKSKLLEKVTFLENIEKEYYEYRKEKEAIIQKLYNTNQRMQNDRNLIISEIKNF